MELNLAAGPKNEVIADYLRHALSTTELCELYGIARKTGYKWIERYLRCGPAGIEERSRRPHESPRHPDPGIVAALLAAATAMTEDPGTAKGSSSRRQTSFSRSDPPSPQRLNREDSRERACHPEDIKSPDEQ